MTIYLFHITSLERAISIIREKRFRPAYSNPRTSDSGLNAGIINQRLSPQAFNATGVRLLLEFDSKALHPMVPFPLPVGHVYDNLPWRVVVPHGTTTGLTMVGIKLDQGVQWHEALPPPPWWMFGNYLKKRWSDRAASQLEGEIHTILNSRPPLIVG